MEPRCCKIQLNYARQKTERKQTREGLPNCCIQFLKKISEQCEQPLETLNCSTYPAQQNIYHLNSLSNVETNIEYQPSGAGGTVGNGLECQKLIKSVIRIL